MKELKGFIKVLMVCFVAYIFLIQNEVEKDRIKTGAELKSDIKDAIGVTINLNGYSCVDVISLEKQNDLFIARCKNHYSLDTYKIDTTSGKVIDYYSNSL